MSSPITEEQGPAGLTPAVQWLLIANVAIYFLQQTVVRPEDMAGMFAFMSGNVIERWWTPLTYAFVHGGIWHIAFNMIALWQFGSELERFIGTKRYAVLYFLAVACAALLQVITSQLSGNFAPMLGASGGVFGLLYGYAACFPNARIIPLIPPIPMPAWLAVSLYGAAELYFGFSGNLSTIAHFAHLGGIIGGFLALPWPWRRQDFAKMAAERGLRYRV